MCEICEWEKSLALLDNMIGNPDFEFAEDTLMGIKKWVEENEHITENQREAVQNIYRSI